MGRKNEKTGRRGLSAKEAASLADELLAQERSERAWKEMTSADPSSDDVWTDVEEHLLQKPHESNHNLRRWKYFAK